MAGGILQRAAAAAAAAHRPACWVQSETLLQSSSVLTSASSLSSSTTSTSPKARQQQEQRRNVWMDVVRVKTDPKSGKRTHEDPERIVRRHQEERRSDGESLLDMHSYNDRHEKAWMKRKRMADLRRYEFDKKHVTDLAKYIAFVQQDNRNENEK